MRPSLLAGQTSRPILCQPSTKPNPYRGAIVRSGSTYTFAHARSFGVPTADDAVHVREPSLLLHTPEALEACGELDKATEVRLRTRS